MSDELHLWTCVRCDGRLDVAGEPVYCSACLKRRESELQDVGPYMLAYCIVSDRRLAIAREERKISSVGCRKLRGVLDYLDIQCDIEGMKWPEVIGG